MENPPENGVEVTSRTRIYCCSLSEHLFILWKILGFTHIFDIACEYKKTENPPENGVEVTSRTQIYCRSLSEHLFIL